MQKNKIHPLAMPAGVRILVFKFHFIAPMSSAPFTFPLGGKVPNEGEADEGEMLKSCCFPLISQA